MSYYLYVIENEPHFGDMQSYAKAVDQAGLAGLYVSEVIYRVDVVPYGNRIELSIVNPTIESSEPHDDLAAVIITDPHTGERGYFTRDLRA